MQSVEERPELRALQKRLYRLTIQDQLLSRRPSAAGPRYARRAQTVDALWESAPFPEHQDAMPVPSFEAGSIDYATFVEATGGYRGPVVIRGFGAETAAVRAWTPGSLVERLGDALCTVVEMDEVAMTQPHSSGRILHQMPFSEFIHRMEDEPLYLHNSTEFVQQCPELMEELSLQSINAAFTDPSSTWDELFSTNLFIGGERVFSNLHCAPGGNFFLQIAGGKRWTLVAPELSPYLFPILSRPFNHCLSVYGSYRKHAHAKEDCALFRLPRFTVDLAPGDLLYNPPWWWHEVENTGATIGCAIRHLPSPLSASPTWQNHPLFSALSVYPQLWALSAWNYLRHQVRGDGGSMRAFINPRLASELNRARSR